ncbi:DUF4145 domain-containing protein [Tautonia marina]|uniref:DUF4145 domain-containing protein n=1 Tax=Tautonia marina TaxID=2653855 RepID=UPI001260C6E4|nr:DUF4145 domain-containing protein [Tautonia marina]
MLCPYCEKHVHIPIRQNQQIQMRSTDVFGQSELLYFYADNCPSCSEVIVALAVAEPIKEKQYHEQSDWEEPKFKEVIYPRSRAIKQLPPEVPPEYREDFDEAVYVLDLSPKSSAALSRRLLQQILRDRFSISKPVLHQEIQEFINSLHPPAHLSDQLDAIRLVGNFAAHPMKDSSTGEITEVEPGEAQWLLETLEGLFDFAFVQPAKFAARKMAINAKLRAAGKPELP